MNHTQELNTCFYFIAHSNPEIQIFSVIVSEEWKEMQFYLFILNEVLLMNIYKPNMSQIVFHTFYPTH